MDLKCLWGTNLGQMPVNDSVEPIIIGLPFGLFFVVLFITIDFVALLALYFIEADQMEE